jgi:hypothetical protein
MTWWDYDVVGYEGSGPHETEGQHLRRHQDPWLT